MESGIWLDTFHKGSRSKTSDFLLNPLISESRGTIAFLCHPGPTWAKTWFHTSRSTPQGMIQLQVAGGAPASVLSLLALVLVSSSVPYHDSFSSGCHEGLQEDLCTYCFFCMDLFTIFLHSWFLFTFRSQFNCHPHMEAFPNISI